MGFTTMSHTNEKVADAGGVPQTGVRRYLAQAMRVARFAERPDLVDRLTVLQDRLDRDDFTVAFVGEFGRGKSALINALIGVSICGVSALRTTSVPTLVRYGRAPRAWAVRASAPSSSDHQLTDAEKAAVPILERGAARVPERGSVPLPERTAVPIAEVCRLSLTEPTTTGAHLSAIEVEIPRQLLSDGLVLVDTPGVGGGFTSVAAASTIRALSFADALVLVTDASLELTAPELEFLTEALAVCPTGLCVVTRTDLYPDWRRIVELDREHLAAAGLDLPVLPVSSVLRELAVDTGDPSLAAESGFPVVVRGLTKSLRERRRADQCRACVSSATAVVDQLREQLSAQVRGSSSDSGVAEERLAVQRSAEERLATVHTASARWSECLGDEVRMWRRQAGGDLTDRLQAMRDRTVARLRDEGGGSDWEDFESWFRREVNLELVSHHRLVLERIRASAHSLITQVDVDHIGLPESLSLPLTPAQARHLNRPESPRASWTDLGVTAARGFSVCGVFGLAAHLVPGLAALLLPVEGALGVIFAVRSVRGLRETQRSAARQHVEQLIAQYLQQVQMTTGRLDEELVDDAYKSLRGTLEDQLDQARRQAHAMIEAAARTVETDEDRQRAADIEQALDHAQRLGLGAERALAGGRRTAERGVRASA
jgi:hypothetical protein